MLSKQKMSCVRMRKLTVRPEKVNRETARVLLSKTKKAVAIADHCFFSFLLPVQNYKGNVH